MTKGIQGLTSSALLRSSREWAAEIHMRALAKSKGVAGKPTITTATYINSKRSKFPDKIYW